MNRWDVSESICVGRKDRVRRNQIKWHMMGLARVPIKYRFILIVNICAMSMKTNPLVIQEVIKEEEIMEKKIYMYEAIVI